MRAAVVVAGVLVVVTLATVSAGASPAPGEAKGSGPIPVVLYAHMFDLLTDAPLNTVAPPANESDLDAGWILPKVALRSVPCPGCPGFVIAESPFVWSFCPGTWHRVAPDRVALGCHDRSLVTPVRLGGSSIPLYFYISADHPSTPGSSRVGAMPQVSLIATLVGYEGGREVVIAESRPLGLASGNMVTAIPGQPHVVELRTDMKVVQPEIPASREDRKVGFLVRVKVVQLSGDLVEAAQPFKVHSGPRFPPRLVLPVESPLVIDGMHGTWRDGALGVEVDVSGRLGSYDVAHGTARLEVRGSQPLPPDSVRLLHAKRSLDHDGPLRPVRFTYEVIPPAQERASEYDVEFRVRNLQGSFEAVQSIRVDVARADGALPPAAVGGLLFVMFVVALLVRARARP